MPDLFLGHADPERQRDHPGIELPGVCRGNPPGLDGALALLPNPRHQLQGDAGLPASAQPVQDLNTSSAGFSPECPGEHIEQHRPAAQRTIRIAAAERSGERDLRAAGLPAQNSDLVGQPGEQAFESLALQAGRVMVQLAGQWCQRAAAGSAEHDCPHQVTGQPLRQHAAWHAQHLG
jgi:hypothetical protein